MTARASRLVPGLLATAVMALGAGCTNDPDPGTTNSPTPPTTAAPTAPGTSTPAPTTASPTPKPSPPASPPEANARTTAGAKAFTQHWLNSMEFALRTGNTRPFLALNSPGCDWCTALAKRYQGVYDAGGNYSVGENAQTVEFFQSVTFTAQTQAVVVFRANVAEQMRTASKGAKPERLKSAVLDYGLNLQFSAGRWSIVKATWHTVRQGS